MKFLAAALLALSFSQVYASDLVTSCQVSMNSMDEVPEKIEMNIQIRRDAGKYFADVTNSANGVSEGSSREDVTISTHQIRANLAASFDEEDLNLGEQIVAHAMMVEADADTSVIFNSGIKDLSKVRSVNTYLVGNIGPMGAVAVVDAFDAKYKYLGSFLGGFLVSPCLNKKI